MFEIGYFNGWLVLGYIVLLAIFLYGILQPRRASQWRSAGAAQAWVIALYAEMYGVPLTAYLAMSWLGRPAADAEVHFNGHLWPLMFGLDESQLIWAQFWCTVAGQAMVLVGALLAIFGWRQLHRGVKKGEMVTGGLYKYVRHPQYTGFFLFLIGSVINWPTLITLVTMPVLLWVYWRLAAEEEQDAIETFGQPYLDYRAQTGRFFPRLGWAS